MKQGIALKVNGDVYRGPYFSEPDSSRGPSGQAGAHGDKERLRSRCLWCVYRY